MPVSPPPASNSPVNAAKTAAAGAHGAAINPPDRPMNGVTKPSAAAPMAPAKAPSPACSGPNTLYTNTPKATEEGKATNMAARPPHKSPASEAPFDLEDSTLTYLRRPSRFRLSFPHAGQITLPATPSDTAKNPIPRLSPR